MSLAHLEIITSDDSNVWNMLHIIAECADLRQSKRSDPIDTDRFQSFIKSLPVMMNVVELERFMQVQPPPKSDFQNYFAAMHTFLLQMVYHSSQTCARKSKVNWRGGTQEWGPVFWGALHLLASRSADSEQGRKMFILNFEITLPCEMCRKDTAIIVDGFKHKLDEIVKSREKTSQLFIDIHDQVNKKLGKPMFQKSSFAMSENVKKGVIALSAVSVIGILIYFIYQRTRKNRSFTVA